MSDLIDRQAAIERVKKQMNREEVPGIWADYDKVAKVCYEIVIEALERLPSAQPELANNSPTLANNSGDLISRQTAIDGLMKRDKALRNINWYDKPYAEGECKGIDEALDIISALPSAQPSQVARDIATIIENEQDMRVLNGRKKGKWIENHTTCSKCGWQMIDDVLQTPNMIGFNFCPNCGAKMEEGD